ncbi:MAG TPA: hypothetical protein VHG08_04220 [Longimicrobium sp.]|nr:hypothetical protein [Longimicrobium sp.]
MIRRRIAALAAFALALGAGGCIFLPIPYTEGAAPPLSGEYQRSDGTPGVGVLVALSVADSDSLCARPAARSTVGEGGRFELPRTPVRRRGILLFPPFEHFWNTYWICAGAAETALLPAFEGQGWLDMDAPPETLSCLEWEWQGRPRVTCSGPRESTLAMGGRWSVGGAGGSYRLIRVEEPVRAPGYRIPVARPRVYLQWVEESAGGPPLRVRETLVLPVDPGVIDIDDLRLQERVGGGWCASMLTTRNAFMGTAQELLAFELGPPGEVREVEACGGG